MNVNITVVLPPYNRSSCIDYLIENSFKRYKGGFLFLKFTTAAPKTPQKSPLCIVNCFLLWRLTERTIPISFGKRQLLFPFEKVKVAYERKRDYKEKQCVKSRQKIQESKFAP